MNAKLIEIRDRCTKIPAVALRTKAKNDEERAFFQSGGYWGKNVVLIRLDYHIEAQHTSAEWGDRTMTAAHRYISEYYDEIPNCSVVDVEYILNETKAPKTSEIWRNK